MKKSKLAKAWHWISTLLLLFSLLSLAFYQSDKKTIALITVLLAIISSTSSYLPLQQASPNSQSYQLAYLASYLSHLVIIIVAFLIALWELTAYGQIGLWFYLILIAVTLSPTVIYNLLKAFSK